MKLIDLQKGPPPSSEQLDAACRKIRQGLYESYRIEDQTDLPEIFKSQLSRLERRKDRPE